MESLNKLLRTPSAFALVVVAFISLIGVVIQTNSSKDVARLSINANSTAHAEQTKEALGLNGNGKSNIPIAIDSQKGWQSTGFSVKAGSIVIVEVVGGKWSAYTKSSDAGTREFLWHEDNGSGIGKQCGDQSFNFGNIDECPIKNYNIGALVGRIGAVKYGIGSKCTFQVLQDGILDLRINDSDTGLYDNSGMLAVTIIIDDSANKDQNCGQWAD